MFSREAQILDDRHREDHDGYVRNDVRAGIEVPGYELRHAFTVVLVPESADGYALEGTSENPPAGVYDDEYEESPTDDREFVRHEDSSVLEEDRDFGEG